MPGLLVSVRSAEEAQAALDGGAAVIDVKEPDRGPLGRADVATWKAIRSVVPASIPLSVALGELREWEDANALDLEPDAFSGITFRKLGLAGAGPGWSRHWAEIRRRWGSGPSWVAVAYADWENAEAPSPRAVLDAALLAEDCAAILVDTWDKTAPSPVDATWAGWISDARSGGLKVALAGGLDVEAIGRLSPLNPNLFAVRGSACSAGQRRGTIDAELVVRLVQAAGSR